MPLHIDITQGLKVENLEELQSMVRLRGGHLIAYSEVVSAVFLSAKTYKVKWVPNLEARWSASLPSSVLTGLLGWWGISGPLWTLTALIWNQRGGYELTSALLASHLGNKPLVGYSEQSAMRALEETARKPALKIVISAIVLVVALFCYLMWHYSR